jgi:hypothetical protein
MPTATIDDLLTELRAIRTALESRPAAPAPPAPRVTPPSTLPPQLPGVMPVIPQPTTVIENAGDTPVHFGKNLGLPLKSLTDRSLSWYAEDKPAKLKDDGTPYPLRPADALLLNAARTYYHQQHGTLTGDVPTAYTDPQTNLAQTPRAPKPVEPKTGVEAELDEVVPF